MIAGWRRKSQKVRPSLRNNYRFVRGALIGVRWISANGCGRICGVFYPPRTCEYSYEYLLLRACERSARRYTGTCRYWDARAAHHCRIYQPVTFAATKRAATHTSGNPQAPPGPMDTFVHGIACPSAVLGKSTYSDQLPRPISLR